MEVLTALLNWLVVATACALLFAVLVVVVLFVAVCVRNAWRE